MCGIAGVVYKKDSGDYSVQIRKMLEIIRHRGPDGDGVLELDHAFFGHKRLAIIDIGDTGHQPMVFEDRYVITFNGEIYNFIEVRKILIEIGYEFYSKSDTEVILASYAEWGDRCVDYLNGMFAFAVYDKREKTLFLARDRVGEKPLYYYHGENEFYFFSEPKQLISTGILKPEINEEAILEYLELQFPITEQTFFKGIYKLPPGCYAKLKEHNFKIHRYWDISTIEIDYTIDYNTAKGKIRSIVEDSLRLRLRSDVPVASYLSGGIDSTVLASIAAKQIPNISTYTFTSKTHPDEDESSSALKTATLIKSDHHEIEMKFSDIVSLWKRSIYFMDEPEVGYSLLSQMVVSHDVAKKSKVVIGGQGGDELFYGYGWFNSIIFQSIITRIHDIGFVDKLKISLNHVLSLSFKGKLKAVILMVRLTSMNFTERYIYAIKQSACSGLLKDKLMLNVPILPNTNCLSSLKKFEFSYWLQGLLHVEDRSSMASGLESRVPLLDHHLIEYVLSLPPSYMIDGNLNKRIFVDAFNDLIPMHVANAKRKLGYVSPIGAWFSDSSVASYIDSIIKNKNSFIYKFVDYSKVMSKTVTDRQLWMLVSLEIWHRIFIIKSESLAGFSIENSSTN